MQINESIFKAYDIRGIYPSDINEENIVSIVKAIYSFFINDLKKDPLTIVLGRDMRISSPSLFEKAKEALVSCGATIVDVGLVSTPTFYFACLHYGYDCGIQISASHNPKDYNGLKFAKRVGKTLLKVGKNTGMEEVRQKALNSLFSEAKSGGKVLKNAEVLKDEIDLAFQAVSAKIVKKFKVVADPANAMGALYLEELFKSLPCELIKMNFELDGTFPVHQPDPLQFELLKDLQKKVLTEKADLGIAPDGDGDRIFFIDEKGKVIPATLISSLVTKKILSKSSNETIIVDIRYLGNVKETTQKYGGKLSISKVGHALITEQLNREHATFAGESSGHFYFRETGGAESSVRTILHVLEEMQNQDKPISQIVEEFQTWFESGEINFQLTDPSNAKLILEGISNDFESGKVSRLDGLSIDYPQWRFNIRTSNTEPLLRLNIEANTPQLLEEKLQELLDKLQKAGVLRK